MLGRIKRFVLPTVDGNRYDVSSSYPELLQPESQVSPGQGADPQAGRGVMASQGLGPWAGRGVMTSLDPWD